MELIEEIMELREHMEDATLNQLTEIADRNRGKRTAGNQKPTLMLFCRANERNVWYDREIRWRAELDGGEKGDGEAKVPWRDPSGSQGNQIIIFIYNFRDTRVPLHYNTIQMADWVQQLDPSKLVIVETVRDTLSVDVYLIHKYFTSRCYRSSFPRLLLHPTTCLYFSLAHMHKRPPKAFSPCRL